MCSHAMGRSLVQSGPCLVYLGGSRRLRPVILLYTVIDRSIGEEDALSKRWFVVTSSKYSSYVGTALDTR
jgi:hypothetical protein